MLGQLFELLPFANFGIVNFDQDISLIIIVSSFIRGQLIADD